VLPIPAGTDFARAAGRIDRAQFETERAAFPALIERVGGRSGHADWPCTRRSAGSPPANGDSSGSSTPITISGSSGFDRADGTGIAAPGTGRTRAFAQAPASPAAPVRIVVYHFTIAKDDAELEMVGTAITRAMVQQLAADPAFLVMSHPRASGTARAGRAGTRSMR